MTKRILVFLAACPLLTACGVDVVAGTLVDASERPARPQLDAGAGSSENASQAAPIGAALVTERATWRYLDDGSDQGTSWRTTAFDDATWTSGTAPLGYDTLNMKTFATTVGFGPNENDKHVTTYFRHVFDVVDATAISSLTLGIAADDGAVVFVNGVEVARVNMPASPTTIRSTTFALSKVVGEDETRFHEVTAKASLLVGGRNAIAVEIHQSDPISSDLRFDLRMTGR